MRLRTINLWLRWLGLVLVVEVDEWEPTRLWVERSSSYKRRTDRE